MAELEIK